MSEMNETLLPDEDALRSDILNAMHEPCENCATDIIDAIRPTLAALQARAEAAEAENARLREALEQIDQPIACGCSACRSDCQSDAAKAIYFEKAREIASAALGDKS